jgi:hypothetical protein
MEHNYNYGPLPGFDSSLDLDFDLSNIDSWDPLNDPLGKTLAPLTNPEPITAPLYTELDYQYLYTMSGHDSTGLLHHQMYEESLNKPYPQEPYYPSVDTGYPYDYTYNSETMPYTAADTSHCYVPATTAGSYESYLSESPNPYRLEQSTPSPSMSYTTPTTPVFCQPQALVCPHPGCNRSSTPFPRQCDLNKHMKTHEKNHLCTLPLPSTGAPCGQRFATMKDLRRHQGAATHGVEASHVCPYCGSAKSRPDNLRDHIRRKHNMEP